MNSDGSRADSSRPSATSDCGDPAHKRIRTAKAERQEQIADVTLKLVAKYEVHGATTPPHSRRGKDIASRSLQVKCYPNREAMLEAALNRLIGQVPRWIARSPGDTAFDRTIGMWAWASDVAGRIGFEQMMGSET